MPTQSNPVLYAAADALDIAHADILDYKITPDTVTIITYAFKKLTVATAELKAATPAKKPAPKKRKATAKK